MPPHDHLSPSRQAERAARGRRLRRQRMLAAIAALVVIGGAVVGALSAFTGAGAGHREPRRIVASLSPRDAFRSGASAAARAQRAEVAEIERLIALGRPIYCAGPRGNAVAFTFDDGPGPYTHLALRKLVHAHERATFFTVGRSIENFPGWVQRETAVAAIGDHTYQHVDLAMLPAAAVSDQIDRARQLIEQATDQPVYLFRPPYGARNPGIDATVRRLGLLEIMWSVDSADSLGANWQGIIRNVEAGLHPGAIILMHENRGQTIRALRTLLPELHRRHLRSVTVPELLAADPPSVAQVQAGEAACRGATAPRHGDS